MEHAAGSSGGSSPGSASAVAAGCVGFAIGTETLGSISSPSTRCGVTGLRPSFGLVPRSGAMALVWSMDKIGPITRSVEDAALVLNTIYGPDGNDLSVQAAGFAADLTIDVRKLRVGYLKKAFDAPVYRPMTEGQAKPLTARERAQREQEAKSDFARASYDAKYDLAALDRLRAMGIALTPCCVAGFPLFSPAQRPGGGGGAAFDELTLSRPRCAAYRAEALRLAERLSHIAFSFAVDYIQAQRARTLALAAMHKLFADFDVIVTPSEGAQLVATNLCGQPAVIVPNGMRGADAPPFTVTEDDDSPDYGGPGTPVSITFLAPLYQDAKAVALAHAYQSATGFHLRHPALA